VRSQPFITRVPLFDAATQPAGFSAQPLVGEDVVEQYSGTYKLWRPSVEGNPHGLTVRGADGRPRGAAKRRGTARPDAAAVASRGTAVPDPQVVAALITALRNLRGRDEAVDLRAREISSAPRGSTTAALEILAALRWQPAAGHATADNLCEI